MSKERDRPAALPTADEIVQWWVAKAPPGQPTRLSTLETKAWQAYRHPAAVHLRLGDSHPEHPLQMLRAIARWRLAQQTK